MKTTYTILTPDSAMPLGRAWMTPDGEFCFKAKPGAEGSQLLKVKRTDPDGTETIEDVWVDVYKDYRNSVGMVFKRIHPGTFLMGSPDSEEGRYSGQDPQHEVTIANGFWLQVTPVTRQQYRDVLGEDPSRFKHDWDCPVEQVSWVDCQRFIAALNESEETTAYRLPSEAEWEYACRAGTTGPFSFDLPITTDKANYNGNWSYAGGPKGEYRAKTTPVRQFDANPWGLYDVHGNVREWCQDTWHRDYVGAPSDGSAWTVGEETNRVLRGGSWCNGPAYLRSADRFRFSPDDRSSNVGFRLVRTLFTP